MTYIVRAQDLIGLPVVTINSGEDLAEIRDVVYAAAEHRLLGFTLNKRGFFAGRMKDVLPAEAVAAIGGDAIMIADEAAITDSGTRDGLADRDRTTSVIGNRVLTADGTDLGEVSGVIILGGRDAEAVGYELTVDGKSANVFVPISAEMAISDDNLLLPADATEFVRNDLAGFGAAITAYRESTLEQRDAR